MTLATRSIPYSYLARAFADPDSILADIRTLVARGDFTLGEPVRAFEAEMAAYTGLPHAVGMASGTDALTLALLSLGIGAGDEVITATNSFVASAGAIHLTGARPVLVDISDDFTIDPEAVERAITPRTKAVIPVHLTGQIADMPALLAVVRPHGIHLVEDAAQAVGATLGGQHAGSWGEVAGYSLHPLKALNVWGDGGICLTRFARIDASLRLLRNHGLASRDDAVCFGANGRLSSLQAVVARHVLGRLPDALAARRRAAEILNAGLLELHPRVKVPLPRIGSHPSYTTYMLRCRDRDDLRAYLLDRGIEVKIHYPRPIHLQTVGYNLGYRAGDCPKSEQQAQEIVTLPCHEYLSDDDLTYMLEAIRGFYGASAHG